jgi:hypothetical protein
MAKGKWTADEVSILLSNYNRVCNTALYEMFPYKTPIAIYKKAYKLGLRKDPEIEFLNRSEARKGEKSSNWNGGIRTTKKGYRMVLCPGHHRSDSSGYVMEHIFVWEKETGIPLPDNCCVHHLNGIKDDNRIENLCVMLQRAHTVHHHTGAKRSESTKALISAKAKERFADKRNHPSYKQIDMELFGKRITAGYSIGDICCEFGIGRTAYYNKRRELENA